MSKFKHFRRWQFLSSVITSMEYTLATHSMLHTAGYSDPTLNLSINYIGKDLLGQIGGMWYVNRVAGDSDKHPKRFIKRQLAIQQCAVVMECATPFVPQGLFLPVAGLANVGQNVASAGLGAINAKMIQQLSSGDVGEIYSKLTVSNTLGSSVGMLAGLLLATKVPDHGARMAVLPILIYLKIYCYNKSIENLLQTE